MYTNIHINIDCCKSGILTSNISDHFFVFGIFDHMKINLSKNTFYTRYFTEKTYDGSAYRVDMKPTLRPNAVPWLFDGVPSYLSETVSSYLSEARSSPSKCRRLVNQRQQLQQSEWLDADHIPSWENLDLHNNLKIPLLYFIL